MAYVTYNQLGALICGIIECVFGVIAIIADIMLMAWRIPTYQVALGLWAGIILCICGAFVIYSSRHPTKKWVRVALGMSVFGVILAIVLFFAAGFLWVLTGLGAAWGGITNAQFEGGTGVYWTLLVVAVVEFIVFIVSLILASQSVCCPAENPELGVRYDGEKADM